MPVKAERLRCKHRNATLPNLTKHPIFLGKRISNTLPVPEIVLLKKPWSGSTSGVEICTFTPGKNSTIKTDLWREMKVKNHHRGKQLQGVDLCDGRLFLSLWA